MLRLDVALQALQQQLRLEAEKTRAPAGAAAVVLVAYPVQQDDDLPDQRRRKGR